MSNGSARESGANSSAAEIAKEQLSALADGELESSAVTAACTAWKEDPQMRAAWHSYQLIGDVLRSDDLAAPSERDRAFMSALRLKLAAEPVVLAPQPAAAAGSRSWGWARSSAVAAGFMAVAGVVFVTRTPAPDAPVLASAPAAPVLALVPSAPVVAAAASLSLAPRADVVAMSVPRGTYLRDPQLDRYLAAHRQFAASSMLGMPSSAYLRNANVEVPGR